MCIYIFRDQKAEMEKEFLESKIDNSRKNILNCL